MRSDKFNYIPLLKVIWQLAIFVASFLLFSHSSVQAQSNGPTYVPGVITEQQIWDKTHSPYIINDSVYGGLRLQAKLTILPGTIIKFQVDRNNHRYYGLEVDGSSGGELLVMGTEAEPVIFTSFFDDSAGGDDNGDGNATQPQAGDIRGLIFNNDSSLIDWAEIRFAGSIYYSEAAIISRNSKAHFNNLKIISSFKPALVVKNNSQVIFNHGEITQSENLAVSLEDNSSLDFNGVSLSDNHGYWLIVMSAGATFKETNNTYINNESQRINIFGNIQENTVWHFSDFEVIASGEIIVLPGAKLDIDQAGYIKWNGFGSRLVVAGELNINGEEGREIIFDSTVDKWGGILLKPGSVVHLNYLQILNAGYYYNNQTGEQQRSAIKIQDSSPVLDDVLIKNSAGYGLEVYGNSQPVIEKVSFENNSFWGILSQSSSPYTVKETKFFGNEGAVVNLDSSVVIDVRENWWGDSSGPWTREHQERNGQRVQGLVLYEPWVGKENIPVTDLEPVVLIPGITGSWQKYIVSGEWQLDPFLHTYDNLIGALELAGFKESNKMLFTFPYQWRQDNDISAHQLKDKIQDIKQLTGKSKVDLVVHSMGGLVARAYIQSDDYQNDVDQVIFLGTPQIGSVNAYIPWESGENLVKGATDLTSKFLNRIFSLEAKFNNHDLFSYVRNHVLSVQQLLPIYDYLIDSNNNIIKNYPSNYPRNYFLESLNQNEQLERLKTRVQVTNFANQTQEDNTVEYLKITSYQDNDGKWEYGYPIDYDDNWQNGLIFGKGDETVPLKSANNLGLPYYTASEKHRDMPTYRQRHVIYALTHNWPTETVIMKIFNNEITLDNYLLINLHSPIDVLVATPDGRKIGKDFISGSEINEIIGAYYTGFEGELEFILIPNPTPGSYKITVQGTGEGEYGLDMTFVDSDKEATVAVQGITELGQTTEYQSNLDLEHLDDWQILPADSVPPVIEITPQDRELSRTDIIDVLVFDLESGLKKSDLILDQLLILPKNQNSTSSNYILELTNLSFGEHIFSVSGQDNAQNVNSATYNFLLSTNISQTIIDAQNIWYKNKGIKLTVLQHLNKIKKDYDNLAKKPNDVKIKTKIKIRINALLIVLREFNKAGLINNEGYKILISDLNYLLSKL